MPALGKGDPDATGDRGVNGWEKGNRGKKNTNKGGEEEERWVAALPPQKKKKTKKKTEKKGKKGITPTSKIR